MPVDYSIIIPAYNEAAWLPGTLAALRQAMAPLPLRGELIVVDNNSSDETAALAREAGATVVFESHNQIARARNAGARQAQGRYLVFVDADTHIAPELLARALAKLRDGGCVGGGAKVGFDVPLNAGARLGLALWNGISARLKLAAGCFIYCRREAFEAVGGFSEAVYASEEIWLSRALRRWGRAKGMDFCLIHTPTAHSSGRKMVWFSAWQQIGMLLLVLFFPVFVRYKRLCGFWYKRPEQDHSSQGE
jgi:glycosyltransferase involved in cell wall biosynthesis